MIKKNKKLSVALFFVLYAAVPMQAVAPIDHHRYSVMAACRIAMCFVIGQMRQAIYHPLVYVRQASNIKKTGIFIAGGVVLGFACWLGWKKLVRCTSALLARIPMVQAAEREKQQLRRELLARQEELALLHRQFDELQAIRAVHTSTEDKETLTENLLSDSPRYSLGSIELSDVSSSIKSSPASPDVETVQEEPLELLAETSSNGGVAAATHFYSLQEQSVELNARRKTHSEIFSRGVAVEKLNADLATARSSSR